MKAFITAFFVTLSIVIILLTATITAISVYPKLHKKMFSNEIKKSGIIAGPYQGRALTNHSGIAWGDYDGDGHLDVLVSRGVVTLYKNNGDGTFTDVTEKAGLKDIIGTGAFFGDYDNDGCPDIYFSGSNRLVHNNCNGTFTDVTQKAGIKSSNSGRGASWVDYDGDGFLDLYVTNYGSSEVTADKYIYFSEPNVLYHNNHDGTFTDVTKKAGVEGVNNCNMDGPEKGHIDSRNGPYKESFQPVWFDYNNDGWPDLFIATDAGISPLYKNNGDGTFTNVTKEAGLCRLGSGMGVTVGDYNNDGNMDIYVTNILANYLWQNQGNGTFREVAAEAKVSDFDSLGWGTSFLDYDNDGNLDLYVVNGIAKDATYKTYEGGKIDRLYKNNGKGSFLEVAGMEGILGNYNKEPVAIADYNEDGFLDIFVVSGRYEENHHYSLYTNQGNSNSWLTIKLIGTKSNRDAIGARIILKANGKTQTREIINGSSFLSQNSPWQTFGLGKSKKIDSIEVRWPSGKKQVLENINVKQTLTITEK